LGIWNRFESLDFLHRHRNFALEGLVFLLANTFLTVHLGLERATLPYRASQK